MVWCADILDTIQYKIMYSIHDLERYATTDMDFVYITWAQKPLDWHQFPKSTCLYFPKQLRKLGKGFNLLPNRCRILYRVGISVCSIEFQNSACSVYSMKYA